ncbi:hypothetical protein NFI96_010824 [Prochilodus magdalenae]|nr:hypothetical protein NFI96_010824 [Prochilodus magdalenae]
MDCLLASTQTKVEILELLKLIRELLKLLGVRKSRTTQGDPQPERFNRTLLSMLGTLSTSQKRQWSLHVASLVHAYNKNDATGYSPYFLMFGREARLPVEVWFGSSLTDDNEVTHSQYVKKLRQDLESAYQLAAEAADKSHQRNKNCMTTEAADKSHQRNKKLYDKLVRFQTLDRGDRVLLKNLGLKGKHKLQSRWNPVPYVVIGKMPNLPVYQVKPEKGIGSVKTLHRDHLLPIGQLVRLPPTADEEPLQRKTRGSGEPITYSSDSESEEDHEIYYTIDMDLPSAKNKETTPSYEIAHDGEEQRNDAYVQDDVVVSDQEVNDGLLMPLEMNPDTEGEGSWRHCPKFLLSGSPRCHSVSQCT